MKIRRFLCDENGAATVEFAVITPILAVLLAGILSFGWLFAISSSLQRLAVEAARVSLMGATTQERLTLAATALTQGTASFPMLHQDRISQNIVAVSSPMQGVRVTLTYDLTGTAAQSLTQFWGGNTTTIVRGAYAAW